MRRPSVIAHRGASGYEYENSRAAFRRAVMLDADGVELDVHATRDGGIVVHHDPELPGVGPIALLSAAEARQVRIRNGETLPLLSEVLELVGDRDVWVEVKSLPALHDQTLLAVLDRGPAPRALRHPQLRSPDRPPAGREPAVAPPGHPALGLPATTRSRLCAPSARRRSGRSGSR